VIKGKTKPVIKGKNGYSMFGKRVEIVGGDFRFKHISLRTIPPEGHLNTPIEGYSCIRTPGGLGFPELAFPVKS
jgi:hypothetical protein